MRNYKGNTMNFFKIFKKYYKLFLFGAVLIVLFANLSYPQPKDRTFRFVVLGDTRPHGDSEDPITQPPQFKENIRAINLLRPDFVIDVGDLIRGYTDDPNLIIREWEDFDHTITAFKMPFHMVVGNHDVWNEESERIYNERYGQLYYSFDFNGSHFIVLDSEQTHAMNNIGGEQLSWLEGDLAAHAEVNHMFVFVHKPLWRYEESNWNADVHPLLARYGVRAVFAGHWHVYTKSKERDGVKYFITGGGGAEIVDPETLGGFYHFMHVSVGDGVEYAVVRPEGLHPADVVTEEMVVRVEEFQRSLTPSILITSEGEFSEKVTLSLSNPFATPIKGEINWNIPGASPWKANPSRCEFTLDEGENLELSFQLSGNGQRAFPLPEIYCEVSDDNGLLVSHHSKLQLKNDWFIREWMVVGPFELGTITPDSKGVPPGFDKAYPPEKKINLKKSYKSMGQKVSWQKYVAEENGFINLDRAFKPNEHVVAYALSYVYSPKEKEISLSLGSDDGAKLWVNDELVFSNPTPRSARPDQDAMMVGLHQGWNKVLVKVEELSGDWGFYLRFANPEGVLKYSASLRE